MTEPPVLPTTPANPAPSTGPMSRVGGARPVILPTRWAAGGLHGLVWSRGAALLERSVAIDVVDRLWHALRGISDLGDFVNALADATGQGLLALPDFAVAVVGRDGQVQVAARGQVVAFVLAGDGNQTVSGIGVDTWSERHVSDAQAVVLQQPEAAANAVERSIESGVVPASSLAFALPQDGAAGPKQVREEARRVPVIEATPEPDSELSGGWAVTGGNPKIAPAMAAGSAFDDPAVGGERPTGNRAAETLAEELIAPVPEPAPQLPAEPVRDSETINAVLCPLGHANPPQRATCRVCQVPLDGPTMRIARPSLGRLITPLGETVDLDGPVIIGRAPKASRFHGTEVPRLLTLAHTHISANHLALRLDGWHVLVQDLGSTNGTFLRRSSDAPFRVSEDPLLLLPGDVIDLGHGVHLRFEDLP